MQSSKEFKEKYSTPVENLADIAAERARKGVYSRLRKDLSQTVVGSDGEPAAHYVADGEEDPDRLAARAALGLIAPVPGTSQGAQV